MGDIIANAIANMLMVLATASVTTAMVYWAIQKLGIKLVSDPDDPREPDVILVSREMHVAMKDRIAELEGKNDC